MTEPSFFAIIPANVRYDERLKPNAKLLYGEITALSSREGYCWAENSYFAELFKVSNETISRWVSQLVEFEYIFIELIEGHKRRIILDKKVVEGMTKKSRGYDKKVKGGMTKKSRGYDEKVKPLIMYSNTINNTINREATPLAFLKENSQSTWEVLMMKYSRQIKAFDKAKESFDLTYITEQREFDVKVINARAQLYFNRWIENESKYAGPAVEENIKQPYQKNKF